jgi:hypothetical protein
VSNEEIFEAKVVILDILGWGVPSQYLLDCGISALVVVVCLSELKLRIPRDLENLIDEAELLVHDHKDSNKMSTGTAPLPKPPPLSVRHPLPPIPVQQSATPPIDLHDIEQQRKQELLARRAALQSMKRSKQLQLSPQHDIGIETSSEPQANDTIMLPVQEGEVDAFLADVIVDEADANPEDSQHYELMEVERALVAEEPEEETFSPASNGRAGSTIPLQPSRPSQPQPAEPQSSDTPTNQPAVSQNQNAAEADNVTDRTLPPSANASHIRPQANTASRRNAKRPVAADFVEYAPQDPSSGSMPVPAPTHSDSNGNAAWRRRNFGPSVQQRLVIDLSDDEGSDGGGENDRVPNTGQSKSAARDPPMIARETSWTATNAVATSREGSTPLDDEKLRLWQLKQREIELMRERIRQMEERTKKRIANPFTAAGVEQVAARSGSEPIATDTLTRSGGISSLPARLPFHEVPVLGVNDAEAAEDRSHELSEPATRKGKISTKLARR